MRPTVLTTVALALGISTMIGTALPAQSQRRDLAEQFTAAAQEYARLHRRIEQSLGPMTVAVSPADILANAKAMAAAISRERPTARQGDFFTPELSGMLRRRIADALTAHKLTPADLATDEVPEGISRQALVLRFGGPFPWVVGSTMLPSVLEVLPELPAELQYRVVFGDLALVDVHANLVVDILPNALIAEKF